MEEVEVEVILPEKLSRTERFKRSVFARLRRNDTKHMLAEKALKEEKEAVERLTLKETRKRNKKTK